MTSSSPTGKRVASRTSRPVGEQAPWRHKEGAEALLDSLARLIALQGSDRFLASPFIQESPSFFPDPWQPTIVGVGRTLHRLLGYAGLGSYRLELLDGREPLTEPLRMAQPRIDFIAAEEGRLVFQLEELGMPTWVPAALCFEVGRAFVATRERQHPYRADAADRAASQEAHSSAAVATVYLGFGLMTANAAHAFAQESEIVGRTALTHRAYIRLGALPAGDLTFLLAVQLVLRGVGESEATRLLESLGRSQADDVRGWLGRLDGAGTELRTRLGIGSNSVPPPWPLPDVAPLAADTVAELEAAEQRHLHPSSEARVTRYWECKTVPYLFIGLFVGLLMMIPLAFVDGLALALIVVPLGTALGAAIGRRHRMYYCGNCWVPLRRAEARCSKCGATVGDDAPLSARKEKLDADLDEDSDLVRQALESPHPDLESDKELLDG